MNNNKKIWKQAEIPSIAYRDFLKNQEQPERNDENYVDFWLKHINYCKSGVNVGGIYISGWLYWHLNFFKIPLDEKDEWGESDRVVNLPKFRDNEYFIDWGIKKAKKESKPLIIFGSRRIAKSTIITSRTAYTNYIRRNSGTVIVGASSMDISNITEYYDKFYESRTDCYSDLKKFGTWSKEGGNVEIAFSKKESTKKDAVTLQRGRVNPVTLELIDVGEDNKYVYSNIAIRNLEHGQKVTKEELLAGITPSEVIFDEIGKYLYRTSFSALKPALITTDGDYRTIPLMVGTGGSTDLAADAEKDFLYTEKSGFCHVDVEEYKKEVNPKYFQYTQKSDLKVGLFPCAEMSNAGGKKIEIPFSEYIVRDYTKKDLEDLEGFTIWVTDWENAKKRVEEEIAKEFEKSDKDGKKAQMYYPFQPEDCFLFTNINPFPVEEAKKTQRALREKGMTGELCELDQDEHGNVVIKNTDKKIVVDYPFKGGSHDAPVVIYERPISENPENIKYGTNVAGFDGYKIATSETTDSLGTIYIFKRKIGLTGYQNQIVASLATRPTQDSKFHRQCWLLLKLYNAELLPERDTNFFKYMEGLKQLRYWANCKNLVQGITPNSIADSTYGLPATPQNKEHYLKLIQKYTQEEIIIGYENEDETKPIIMKGVERIPDPMLLEEIVQFGRYKNYDRIVAFGHALAWDAELTVRDVKGGQVEKDKEVDADRLIKKIKIRPNKYSIRQ